MDAGCGDSAKDTAVSIDRIVNLLAAVTLFEMMVTIGLGVKIADVAGVARDRRTVARALVANYLLVPAAAVGLLLLFHAAPLVAAGFLIAAVCPGAQYGPPFTELAKGNVPLAVGLMLILAGSSAVAAPLLLGLLLPLVSGDQQVEVDTAKIVETLLEDQLLPLCAGLFLRHRLPALADRLVRPARALSLILNVALLGTILTIQFGLLVAIPRRAFGAAGARGVRGRLAVGWSGPRRPHGHGNGGIGAQRFGQLGHRHGELSRYACDRCDDGVRAVSDDRNGADRARMGASGATPFRA